MTDQTSHSQVSEIDSLSRVARLPVAPTVSGMWKCLLIVISIVMALFLLDRLSALLLNFWLLESMNYTEVFWTNFQIQASLFIGGTLIFCAAVAAPAFAHGLSKEAKVRSVWIGALGGLLMGYWLNTEYLEFLGATANVAFGKTDPVFGNDISFYVFDLPPIAIVLLAGLLTAATALIASVSTALMASRDIERPDDMGRLPAWLGRIGTPYTMGALLATGLLAASLIWMRRYGLLTMPNFDDSTEETGAGPEYVDVEGFFSTLNSIYVEALAILALSIGLTLLIRKAYVTLRNPEGVDFAHTFRPAAFALVLLPGISADLAFRVAVEFRDYFSVVPNEPVVQLPYLQRHIDATMTAFGLDDVEERTFVPKEKGDPMPSLASMVNHPGVKNAPLWSGAIQRYSRRVAPQYVQRILAAEGNMMVYGPTMEILQAQQTLRPYYGFMDVDTMVSQVDGEMTLMSSAVRELPQDIIRPWLMAWGQRSLLFTHGHGLVTMSVTDRTEAGDPVYLSGGVPIQASAPSLQVENPAIYYGEGAVNPAMSNLSGINEHDIATDQGRIEVQPDNTIDAGITVDSWLKRLVIGYRIGELVNVFFSDLITDESRFHVLRRPVERIEQLAPFLLLDTDPYAVPNEQNVTWMVNAMTWSDAYPYSAMATYGDPADLRTEWRPQMLVNYIADSVKATIDADSGQVTLYKISDEPVVETWAGIYPTLFTEREAMPERIQAQMQYPPRLMSIQFNKIFPFYHQRDALTFYSGEDLLDDSDEVVGPIMGTSGAAITFSQGLYYWLAKPGGNMPESNEPVQFAYSKTYTPQDPLNLRAIVTAYQTGEDYGKLSVLKVPKGQFYMGPEQADAAIDQDAYIAQQIGLWNRLGVEVIRGRTSLMVVEGEALYVEPIFIRSRQNPVPQLQRVIIVFRGKAYMGTTIEEALEYAIEGRSMDVANSGPSQAYEAQTASLDNTAESLALE